MAIESTLRALADAMAEHRRQLAAHLPPGSPATAGSTAAETLAPSEPAPIPTPAPALAPVPALAPLPAPVPLPAPSPAPVPMLPKPLNSPPPRLPAARPAPAPAAEPLASNASPVLNNASPVQRVMQRACALYGIAVGETVEAKLRRILGAAEGSAVDRWIAMLLELPHDHPEWLALAESLTVHETYVWRDGNQLTHLREAVLPGLIAAEINGERRLRLLSAGCSTGEEAYTLALIALDALVAAGQASETNDLITLKNNWRVEVMGVDLSRIAIRQAENAVYETGELSAFRDTPAWVERFFPKGLTPGTRAVREDVRRLCSFKQWNLVQTQPPWTGYHVVACRNLLIYLTSQARSIVYDALAQGMARNSVLLVGPTDLPQGRASFKPDWGKGTVIWRRAEGGG